MDYMANPVNLFQQRDVANICSFEAISRHEAHDEAICSRNLRHFTGRVVLSSFEQIKQHFGVSDTTSQEPSHESQGYS